MKKMLLLLIMSGVTQVAAKDAYNWKQFMMGCTQGGGGEAECAKELKNKCNDPQGRSDCFKCTSKRPGMVSPKVCYQKLIKNCIEMTPGNCDSEELCRWACSCSNKKNGGYSFMNKAMLPGALRPGKPSGIHYCNCMKEAPPLDLINSKGTFGPDHIQIKFGQTEACKMK